MTPGTAIAQLRGHGDEMEDRSSPAHANPGEPMAPLDPCPVMRTHAR